MLKSRFKMLNSKIVLQNVLKSDFKMRNSKIVLQKVAIRNFLKQILVILVIFDTDIR